MSVKSEAVKKTERKRFAAGLCKRCGKQPPAPERVYCEACLAASRERANRTRDRREAEGRCVTCGGERENPAVKLCSACRQRDLDYWNAKPLAERQALSRERTRRMRARRREAGLCTRCYDPAIPGQTLCEHHAAEAQRQRWANAYGEGVREAVFARDGHQCWLCGETERLHLHHIDGNGARSAQPNNDLTNLVTLCTYCHSRLEKLFRKEGIDLTKASMLVLRKSPFESREQESLN